MQGDLCGEKLLLESVLEGGLRDLGGMTNADDIQLKERVDLLLDINEA